MQDVISQSNGAISDVRTKLQQKEEVIQSLEEQLQSRRVSGTHTTSPYSNRLLDYKASPMRDLLLTDGHARPRNRGVPASPGGSRFQFKSPMQRLTRQEKASNASSGGFIVNEARVDNFALPTPISSPVMDDSPFYANAHKLVEARFQRKESNMYMSYMEPVGASTLIGQSMLHPNESPVPSPDIRSRPQVKAKRQSPRLQSNTTRAKSSQNSSSVPFVNYVSPQSNHLYPSNGPPPREPATRKSSRCQDENNAKGTSHHYSSTNESTFEYVEQIISPTPKPKYLDVFKENANRKRPLHDSMSSVNSSVNQSHESKSVRQPRGKIQKLVQQYEFNASVRPETRRRVLPPRQAASTRRRSLNSKRRTPPAQRQRQGNHTRARTNKTTELRMQAQKKMEEKGEKKLFSIGKF